MENMEKENGGNVMARKAAVKPAQAKTTQAKAAQVKAEAKPEVKPEVKETVKPAEAPKAEAQPVTEAPKTEEAAEKPVQAKAVKAEKPAKAEKKTSVKPEKTTAKKDAAKEDKTQMNIVIEYHGDQRRVVEIMDKIKAEWVEAGHRVSSIKSLDVYIKPEEYTAYYVINGKVQGKVWM